MNNDTPNTKVLVVDDEQDVGFLIKSMLKPKGIDVGVCLTANDCLSKVSDFKPTHIILDINLQDGNGLEILPQIKKAWPAITVYIHSAMDTTENREKAQARGAEGFLAKPLNRNKLEQLFAFT